MKIQQAKIKYRKEIIPKMMEMFNFSNPFQVPRLQKITLNIGIGKISKEKEKIDEAFQFIRTITGQNPVKTKAKKAIAGFKTREGQELGIKVTLRGKRMWDFVDKLINSSFPRIKDFQGINPKAVDEQGNLNVGLRDHIVFPEILAEKTKNIFSFQVCASSSAKNRKEGMEFFKLMGFPIKK